VAAWVAAIPAAIQAFGALKNKGGGGGTGAGAGVNNSAATSNSVSSSSSTANPSLLQDTALAFNPGINIGRGDLATGGDPTSAPQLDASYLPLSGYGAPGASATFGVDTLPPELNTGGFLGGVSLPIIIGVVGLGAYMLLKRKK
jgi:hypothetical protein